MTRRASSRLTLLMVCLLLIAGSVSLRAASGEALAGLDGGQLAAEDLERGTTILVVWATWSPRCRDIVGRLDRLADTWSDKARVASVVFQEEPETVRAFLDERGLACARPRVPVFLDTSGDFSKQHDVTSLPMLLVFRDGRLAFRGKLSASPDPVIERALAGEP